MSDAPPPGTTPPPAAGQGAGSSNGAPPPGAGAPPPPDWRTHITDEAMRNASFVSQSQAKTIEEALNDMVKQNFNAQKLIGGEKVLRPQDNWSAEQWREWRESVLKTPKTVDGYAYDTSKYKDIIDDKALGNFKEMFLREGLTPSQVNGILDNYFKYAAESYKTLDESTAAKEAEKAAALRKAWGNEYDKNKELVDYAITRMGGDEAKEYFKNNPSLLTDSTIANFLLKAGKMVSGDNPSKMNDGQPGTSRNIGDLSHPVEIRNEISRIRRDPDYEKVVRAGGPSALRAQMASRGEGSAEATIEKYIESNKQITALYEKLGSLQ